jgi:ribose transport system ATP-binding protein
VPLALASIGQLHVLLLGQFDVSIGALMGLTVVCASFLVTDSSWSWILLGMLGLLAIATSVGVLNVVLVRWLSIPSIIATIATLSVLRGITLMLRPTPEGLISATLIEALTASWGFVPYSFVGVVGLAILADLWLYRTRDGLTTRAVGFEVIAATRMGVSSRAHYVRAFILASVFAGAGGLFLAALVGVGDPRLGTSFTLPTLAAAVLGGAALGGGRGSFIGAVNGALFFTLIINVLPFLGWPASWGDVARGAVTLGALAMLRGSELLRLVRRSRRAAVRPASSRSSTARRPRVDDPHAGAANVAGGDDAAVAIVGEVVPGPVEQHVGAVAEADQIQQVEPEPGEPAEPPREP